MKSEIKLHANELDVWNSVARSYFASSPAGDEIWFAQEGHRWLQPRNIDQPKSGGWYGSRL